MAEITLESAAKSQVTGRNWALLAGIVLVLVVLVAAAWGPRLSPADPLQESFIGRTIDDFVRPPYAPWAVKGYPLGSDEFGRDVLSRILWGIRPTMVLVSVVAALRLVLGTLLDVGEEGLDLAPDDPRAEPYLLYESLGELLHLIVWSLTETLPEPTADGPE